MSTPTPWARTLRTLAPALFAVLVFVVLVAVGREVDHGRTKVLVELAAVGVLGLLAMYQRGMLIAVLVLAGMNGVPFFDTSRPALHHIAVQDVACFALVGVSLAWIVAGAGRHAPPIARRLGWCGALLLAWCLFTALRSWATGGAPLLGGLREGRDFMYFGALLMVLPRVRLTERELRALLAVLVAGVCLFSIGQIATIEGYANPTYLVHATATGVTLGSTRVYAQMNDLLFAGVAIGVAAVVLGVNRRVSIPVTLLLLVSLAVQLTRARWIALIASFVVVSAWFVLQGERRAALAVRRRIPMILGLVVLAVALVAIADPALLSGSRLLKRVLSAFTDVGASSTTTSTVAVRQQVAGAMLQLLGGRWPIGVGLIPPSAHYYLTLPGGALRDPDVGVMNAVMTIGVIGAALIYAPFIVMLRYSMRIARTTVTSYQWLIYGGQIWIVASLISSITLITLFSVGGLVMSAALLSVLCQPVVAQESIAASEREADDQASSAPRPARDRLVYRGDALGDPG